MRHITFAIWMMTALARGSAVAQTALPETENGRYTLAPIADGFLRLDSRTGTVSTCRNEVQGWACFVVPDERAAFDAEIGRLQAENQKLRAQPAERDVANESPKIEIPKIEIPLPSERDINRVVGFLEDAWRRLVDMAARMQRNTDGKI